ncbi:DUF1559 family PulG-like putative transporter [Tautonia rosea]|nr:DUF1559 domain-containing protein [Tautonia rosea]
MTGRRFSRNGFTIVELIVAVSVIAILVGLLIPAVSMARSASHRIQCANQLRQIGLAMHTYEASYGVFPAATSGSPSARSFLVALLPHIDQKNLFNSINFSFDLMNIGPQNRTASSVRINVLHCPSDNVDRPGWPVATSYAGNQGGGVQKYGPNGVFPGLTAVRLRDISDGTSNTAAMSEWVIGPVSPALRDPLGSVFRTATEYSRPDELDLFTNLCRYIDLNSASVTTHPKGVNWLFGELGYSLYNHVLPPNEKSCLNGTAYQQGAWTASSRHRNGTNLLFADGRVEFYRNHVDQAVWRALASRNGGELAVQQ